MMERLQYTKDTESKFADYGVTIKAKTRVVGGPIIVEANGIILTVWLGDWIVWRGDKVYVLPMEVVSVIDTFIRC